MHHINVYLSVKLVLPLAPKAVVAVAVENATA
jgi:hypothetical protein